MEYNNDGVLNDREHSEASSQPNAIRVDDDDNMNEKELERTLLTGGGGAASPVREGQPMGGQSFGQNNLTTAGDDKNNPSRNAGYGNAYFARTEPSEEHPEDTNFKDKQQDGAPDYGKAQSAGQINAEEPKPEKVERGNGENDRPHEEEPFTEGTADNDQTNIPGPDELPDQQKVGEEVSDEEFNEDHIER